MRPPDKKQNPTKEGFLKGILDCCSFLAMLAMLLPVLFLQENQKFRTWISHVSVQCLNRKTVLSPQ